MYIFFYVLLLNLNSVNTCLYPIRNILYNRHKSVKFNLLKIKDGCF